MMFWKKVCSILLATLLVLGTGTLASAAEEPTLRIVSVTTHPGESVDVAVEIVRNPGIIAALVQIAYDREILTLDAVQDGGLLGTGTMVPGGDKTAVPYNVLWSDSLSTTNHTQDGILVTFTFQVREDAPLGDTTVSLTCSSSSCFNCDLQPVSFQTQSGTVTVTSSGAHTHEYTSVVTPPTCTEKGYTTYTCSRCGDSYTEDIETIPHTEKTVRTEPTCTAKGEEYTVCAVCDKRLSETQEIPALGHDYDSTVTPPTCTEKGYTTYTCSMCGDSYTADETEAAGHKYDSVVTLPTCTEKGYTTYTCSACGDSYKSDETEALGHSFGAWVVVKEATQTEAGQKRRECSACDAFETLPIPMLPTVAVRNFQSSRTVDYRTTITFAAVVNSPVDGAEVHWFVDGKDMGTGDTYTVKEAKKTFTVQAKYMQDGKTLAESETETVSVKTGFFAKLAAFFKALFRKLPVLVQEYVGMEKLR